MMTPPSDAYGPALSPGDLEIAQRFLELSVLAPQIDPHINSAAHKLAGEDIDRGTAESVIRYILVYHPLPLTAWSHAVHLSDYLTKRTILIPPAFDPGWMECHVFDDYPEDELEAFYYAPEIE